MTDPYAPLDYAPQTMEARTSSASTPATPAPRPPQPERASVPDGSVREVLDWVGDDGERARTALDAESARDNPRKSLLRDLNEMLRG